MPSKNIVTLFLNTLVVFSVFIFYSCCTQKRIVKTNDVVESVNFFSLAPDVFADDINNFRLDSITAICVNDNVIFFLSPILIRDKNGLLNNKNVSRQLFIFKRGDNTGFFYDSLNSGIFKTKLVAEFLDEYTFVSKNPFTGNDSLLSKQKLSRTKFSETYILKQFQPNSYDTLLIAYDNSLSGSYFSLSPIGDSLKKNKISEIRFIINPNEKNSQGKNFYWELRKHETSGQELEKLKQFIDNHNRRLQKK